MLFKQKRHLFPRLVNRLGPSKPYRKRYHDIGNAVSAHRFADVDTANFEQWYAFQTSFFVYANVNASKDDEKECLSFMHDRTCTWL